MWVVFLQNILLSSDWLIMLLLGRFMIPVIVSIHPTLLTAVSSTAVFFRFFSSVQNKSFSWAINLIKDLLHSKSSAAVQRHPFFYFNHPAFTSIKKNKKTPRLGEFWCLFIETHPRSAFLLLEFLLRVEVCFWSTQHMEDDPYFSHLYRCHGSIFLVRSGGSPEFIVWSFLKDLYPL